MNQMCHDLDLAAVEVEFLSRFAGGGSMMPGPAVDSAVLPFGLDFGLSDGGNFTFLVHLLFGDTHRIAVEVRVGKQSRCGAGIVQDVEPEFAVVIPKARAAPDDLLELAHGSDDARQHDILAGRRIDAGREELR